jgi:hypothetical protein
MGRRCLLVLLLTGELAGAVRAQDSLPPAHAAGVTGRRVVFQPLRGSVDIRGELLGARGDSAWVLEGTTRRVVAVRLSGVRSADVQRHGLTAGKGLVWGVTVGVLTGAGLTVACSQVTDGCGGVFVGATLAGLVWGSLAAVSYSSSSRWRFEPVAAARLAPFARFPQGPPPAMLDSLAVRPEPASAVIP